MLSLREFNLVNCPSVPVKQEIRFNGIKIERGTAGQAEPSKAQSFLFGSLFRKDLGNMGCTGGDFARHGAGIFR